MRRSSLRTLRCSFPGVDGPSAPQVTTESIATEIYSEDEDLEGENSAQASQPSLGASGEGSGIEAPSPGTSVKVAVPCVPCRFLGSPRLARPGHEAHVLT